MYGGCLLCPLYPLLLTFYPGVLYLLFGWQDFEVSRFASRAKLKIRNAKPGLACKHPDAMFTLYQITLAQAHGS